MLEVNGKRLLFTYFTLGKAHGQNTILLNKIFEKLEHEIWPEEFYELTPSLETLLGLNNTFALLIHNPDNIEDAVGYVLAEIRDTEVYLARIAVLESFRKNTLGTRLLETVKRLTETISRNRINLICKVNMRPWYEQRGFSYEKDLGEDFVAMYWPMRRDRA